jgi:hypothetical protein
VKAFGTLGAESLASGANRSRERAVLFYATDFPEARRVVEGLVTASGFSPVRVGGIDQPIRIEVGGDLHEFGKLGKLGVRERGGSADLTERHFPTSWWRPAVKMERRQVSTIDELRAAAADTDVQDIAIAVPLDGVPSLCLSPGQALTGCNAQPALRFAAGSDGVDLSADNRVEGLELVTDPDKRAIFNDTGVERLGRLGLHNLTVTGVVRLLTRDRVRGGHIDAHNIDILAADGRGYEERPRGYGVEVVPGAFTLWNQHDDPAITITADLTGLSAGRAGAPVRGSGTFVSGNGNRARRKGPAPATP